MSIRSEPMPMIMPGLRLSSVLAAAVHRRAHGADGLAEADEHRLADHEVADVEFDDLRQRRRSSPPSHNRGRGRHGPRARPSAPAWRLRRCAAIRLRPLRCGHRPRRRTSRRCGSRSPARAVLPPSRSGAGSAAMNSDTRMPASFSRAMKGASALCWPTTSRPPSVVSSSRRSGTRHTACGLVASEIRSMSVGRRHLEIQRL